MKKIAGLFLIILFHAWPSIGQVSNVVDLKLPDKTVKVLNTQLKVASTDDKASSNYRDKTVFYALDGLKIGFADLAFDKEFQRPLESKMRELVGISKGGDHSNVIGAIRIFNNIRFIIVSYDEPNLSYIRFYSEYHNDHIISGVVQFNKVDKEKATGVLNGVLNSMVFKN